MSESTKIPDSRIHTVVAIIIISLVTSCVLFMICCRKNRLQAVEDDEETRRERELTKYIEDTETRKKRLTVYFHRCQCRMVSFMHSDFFE
jgi:predicted restriction endonuclease